MNILSVCVSFAILLKCVAASGEDVGVAFREAVDRENFEWLKENYWDWKGRKDLLDSVIAKGVDFTVNLIQNVEDAQKRALAALFVKGKEGVIDEVLGGIKYDDNDLWCLAEYRRELAGSPEKFFRVLDKIEGPKNQEWAVREGVSNLFEVGRHDLIPLLVDALGEEAFKNDRLEEEAIQTAFYQGARRGSQAILREYYEHPAVTSEKYAVGLYKSWNDGKPNQIFSFLLEQADQEDLDKAKKECPIRYYADFCQAIGKALEAASPTGSRHQRFFEKAKLAMHVLDFALDTGMWNQEPGNILASYLVGEEVWTKDIERMKMKKRQGALQEGKQKQLEVVQVREGGGAQVQARHEGGRKKARRGLKRRQQRKRKSARRRHQRRR